MLGQTLVVAFAFALVFHSAWAVVVGPNDGWLLTWLIMLGSAGVVGGAIVGALFYLLARYNIA
jgi:hypothetical protein